MSAAEQLEPRGPGHGRLWSLWEMLRSYHPIYELAQELHEKRYSSSFLGDKVLVAVQQDDFGEFLDRIQSVCADYGFLRTASMAKRAATPLPSNYRDLFSRLDHLHGSLSYELEGESFFRIPRERVVYYESDDGFGPEVADAFPSCLRIPVILNAHSVRS